MIQIHNNSVHIRVKAVPGASRDQISGVLAMPGGDRLKIRISAPPEGGKANKAICALIAHTLGVRPKQVGVESGASSAEKTIRVVGIEGLAESDSGLDELRTRLLGS